MLEYVCTSKRNQPFFLSFNSEGSATTSFCAFENQPIQPFVGKPIQLVVSWSLKKYGDKSWRKFMFSWIQSGKLRVTAFSGPLVIFVRGCGEIKNTSSQDKSEWSKESFITHIGFQLPPNKIHGIMEVFAVELWFNPAIEDWLYSLIWENESFKGCKTAKKAQIGHTRIEVFCF